MEPGKTYHIYNHGNADDNLFRSNENYSYFLRKYEGHLHSIVITYAFCLMPNHFHFLLKVKDEDTLKRLPDFENLKGSEIEERIIKRFSNFFNGYTKAFNKMYGRRGKLFLLPFKRKPVTDQWHFLNTWKYIHFNPVHHGFCKSPYEWAFSSVQDYRLTNSETVCIEEAKEKAASEFKFKLPEDFEPKWKDSFDIEY